MQQQIRDTLTQKYETIFCEPIQGTDKKCCPCFEECLKSVMKKKCLASARKEDIVCNQYAFLGSWNAQVGELYSSDAVSLIPRVMFLGKENRSNCEQLEDPANFAKRTNQHYRRTRAILAALLGLTEIVDESNCDKTEKSLTLQDTNIEIQGKLYPLHTIYALSNHYHCAFKTNDNVHNVPCTNKMWNNCAKIVQEELAVLQPHIFVIQAGWSIKQKAAKTIQEYYYGTRYEVVPHEDKTAQGFYWLKQNGKTIGCIIGSYHPSFHQWHKEEYLQPLNDRIRLAKQWWKEYNK